MGMGGDEPSPMRLINLYRCLKLGYVFANFSISSWILPSTTGASSELSE